MMRWPLVGATAMLLVGTALAEDGAAKGDKKKPAAAKKAPKSEALESLCDLNAERMRDLQEIDQDKMAECGSSPMSPGVPQCYQEYENQKMRVMQRHEARMTRFREKAEKQLGRKLKDGDCCDALPSRYRLFGSNCMPVQ
jgi:hypothetical protein